MYTVRIWVPVGKHYESPDLRDCPSFPTHDEAWEECKRLLNQGVMCDTIRRY